MVQASLLLYVNLLISPNPVCWWLLCNMKHDTSSIILYMCLAISAGSIWPLLSPDTQIPFPRPGAVLEGTITPLLFLRGSGVTMMSDCSRSRLWQNIQQLTVSALLGPIVNSSKLTIWRQQLWVMKKGKKKIEGRRGGNPEVMGKRSGKIKAGWNHVLAHRWMCSRASNRSSRESKHSWTESSTSRKFCLSIHLRTSPSNKT